VEQAAVVRVDGSLGAMLVVAEAAAVASQHAVVAAVVSPHVAAVVVVPHLASG
jgi:hypothetical protein